MIFFFRFHKRGCKRIDIAFCYVKSLVLEWNHDCRMHIDKKFNFNYAENEATKYATLKVDIMKSVVHSTI